MGETKKVKRGRPRKLPSKRSPRRSIVKKRKTYKRKVAKGPAYDVVTSWTEGGTVQTTASTITATMSSESGCACCGGLHIGEVVVIVQLFFWKITKKAYYCMKCGTKYGEDAKGMWSWRWKK